MFRILAGNLSATFNLDGQHFDRYVANQTAIVRSLCDHLLLHDQIFILTQDYLTAAGLIRILGERAVLALLEEERIRFIRMRGAFGYVRGTGPKAYRSTSQSPQDMSVIGSEYKERERIPQLLMRQSSEIPMEVAVDATHLDTYADLSRSSLWKEKHRLPNPELIALPGAKKMGARVIGPGTDATKNVIDTCLALGLMNIELYLAKRFDCENVSTASPIGDIIALKLPRLTGAEADYKKLWSFLDVAGIPDICGPLMSDKVEMAKFIKLSRTPGAEAFRRWFGTKSDLTAREILKEYIGLLGETPWIQGKAGRTLRMAASLGLGTLGLGFLVDATASIVDSFVVDKVVRARGAKFFIEKLRNFAGHIASKP